MPIYTYQCCEITEEWLTLAELDNPIYCKLCGKKARRIPSRVSTGIVVNQKLKDLSRVGIVPHEKGMDVHAKRAKEYKKEKDRQAIREFAGNFVREHYAR